PAPSQTMIWQSLGVCFAIGMGVSTMTLANPQVPLVHTVAVQSMLLCGQSAGVLHSTHCPAESQSVPPFVLQGDPSACRGFEGVPAVQTSSSQSVAVFGTSALSSAFVSLPPWQIRARQSPSTCTTPGVSMPSLSAACPQVAMTVLQLSI